VIAYVEKPEMRSVVSMGIYVLDPEAIAYIPESRYFDFPDLVRALLDAKEPVGAYAYDGLWFDIGRREDYETAVAAWLDANPDDARGHLESYTGEQAVP
jgi:NDP-sugar pyrophosphorylase family protein